MERSAIFETRGDLFSVPEDFSLAHCVSRDLKMGKGIAVQFKQRFGRVEELRNQRPVVGSVVYLQMPGRCIFYLVTKEKYFEQPTYESLQQSLNSLKTLCLSLGIFKIAMPRLGCGLDGLSWSIVQNNLQETFKSEEFDLRVYFI